MPFNRLCALLTGVAIALSAVTAQAQAEYDGQAPNVLVMDYNTGQVLVERNADVPLPPASMSKLMTLNMLFEAIDEGRVDLDTTFTVSERAYAMGGSRMFLETRDRPTAEDLIRGIAVLSGNDATVVVAEGLAGSEEAFAQLATARARQLGMEDTNLTNASGWPDPEHRMSLRDLAILSAHLVEEHPDFYPYLAEREFTWNDITQPNRVPLLGTGLGLDGLKTGHTTEAGYALTGSAVQGERRVIFVFSGLDSARARTEEAERIINWAFRQFTERRVVEEGQTLAAAEVWMGAEREVPLIAPRDLDILVPVFSDAEVEARVVYDGPLPAPIAEGDEVARLIVQVPEMNAFEIPLVAGRDVAEGGFMPRMRAAATVLAGHLGLNMQ
ncbi:MAG: D-alanyl-D-alanine carboxypeptidase (penicillin-binding protein 5/6) [Rhodobacteraceae bacterium HLUCCA12]|nr:MAG: D-alanyl-D-alanine carboxypeptidase (penicillin-binding protein 5/6) [Rhodobacteraceae bacterium HLUCCA12]